MAVRTVWLPSVGTSWSNACAVGPNTDKPRSWPIDRVPASIDDPAVRRLFAKGGSLYLKKRFALPIRGFNDDGTVDFFRPGDEFPLPRGGKHLEAMFTIALFHELGWPDKAVRGLLADAVYNSMMLAFEFDEAQHYASQHHFNKLKPGYQAPRDKRVAGDFLRLGYWVCRVRGADYSKEDDFWSDISLEKAYDRTREAVGHTLAWRQRTFDAPDRATLHYYPRILVWPDDKDRSIANTVFLAKELEDHVAHVDFDRTVTKRAMVATDEARKAALVIRCRAVSSFVGHALATLSISETVIPTGAALVGARVTHPDDRSPYAAYFSSILDNYVTGQVLEQRRINIRAEMDARGIQSSRPHQQ